MAVLSGLAACTSPPPHGSGASADGRPGSSAPAAVPAPTDDVADHSTDHSADDPTDHSADDSTDDRLLLALSVHVERHQGEASDRATFDQHVALLDELAVVAADHDVVLNFEAETEFVAAATAFGPEIPRDLIASGHSFSQHSGDRSTSGLTAGERTTELRRQRDALASLGVTARYLSGACPGDGWVEAAADAEFEAATGLTEICLQSLDDAHLPAGMAWIRSCASATICHDPLHLEPAASLHPWTTDSSASWLGDIPDGRLVLVVGQEATALSAMSAEADYDATAAVEEFGALLDQLDAARTAGRLNATGFTISIGPEPDWDVLRAMFTEVSARADRMRWARYDEIIDRARSEAGAPADPPLVYTDTTPDDAGATQGSGRPPRSPGATLPPG